MPNEYLVISASRKSRSRSRALASHLMDFYRSNGHSATLLDLREVELPFCDGEEAYGHPETRRCEALVEAARVIVLAAPVYNYDLNAVAKNFVELTGDAWENKVVGFMCAAGGTSSYMSVMPFANSLMLDFRCLIIPRFVYATGEDFKDGALRSEEVLERVLRLGEASVRVRHS